MLQENDLTLWGGKGVATVIRMRTSKSMQFFLSESLLPSRIAIGVKVGSVPGTQPLPDLSDPELTDGPLFS